MKAVVCIITLVAAACGDEAANSLDGSITGSFDMGFTSVRVRRDATDVSIEYVKDPWPSEELVLRIPVSTVETDIPTAGAIDLHPPTGDAPQRTTLDGLQLPELCPQDVEPSTLSFYEYGEQDGDTVSGEWRMCFDRERDDDLRGVGTFSAPLEVMEP